MRIVLIGASGFFGEYLLRALTAERHHCVVLTRNLARRKKLGLMSGVELVQADVYDTETLAEYFAGADAVVSMAGILNESGCFAPAACQRIACRSGGEYLPENQGQGGKAAQGR